MFVLVLAAGFMLTTGPRPPWAVQPATDRRPTGRADARRMLDPTHFAALSVDDDDNNIVMDTLRVLGIVRKKVDRPVVGRKAYVRWWERLRALVVLGAIVLALGVAVAAVVGITVLGLGFLLEQAIS